MYIALILQLLIPCNMFSLHFQCENVFASFSLYMYTKSTYFIYFTVVNTIVPDRYQLYFVFTNLSAWMTVEVMVSVTLECVIAMVTGKVKTVIG